MTTISDDELERLNQELINKRAQNKAQSGQIPNDIESCIKHAKEMAEQSKNTQREPECTIDILPKINATIPKRFSLKTFANYDGQDELKEQIKKSAVSGRSIMLTGLIGTGKTHLAISSARLLIKTEFEKSEQLLNLKITTISEMQSAILDKVKTIDDYKRAEVLIIDDLGAEKDGDWINSKIFELINYRYMQELPTIITTNLNGKELAERIGQRTVSRIVEMCDCYRIEGKDYRLKGGVN